jgi:zinc protease
VVLLLLTLVLTNADAQTNLSDKIPVDSKVKIGKLENGLTYYIRENKRPEKKVELRLVVNAGSINEDDDQQGLAHMAEHMAFNGTKNFKKNEIVTFLQDIGVGFGSDLNAYTSFDETVYILPIPTDKKENIEKGFQVLEDWAHQVTYLDEDINSERAIILEESRLGKGAFDRMFKKVYSKLFTGSKYANRLPIGEDSIIKSFKPDVIRKFYKDWYRPDLMAVIVVGDIDPALAEQMVKKHFSTLKPVANPRPRESYDVPAYASSDAVIATDKEATEFNVSVNYPAFKDKPATTLEGYRDLMIEQLYTSLFNQRLQEVTQKENAPFIYGYVGFDSYARGYKSFNALVGTGNNDPKKGLDGLMEEIERVKRYGFTEAELERAKKSLLTSYERSYNNREKTESGNFVQEYIGHFLQHEPIPGIEAEFNYAKSMLPSITLAEVNKMSDAFRDKKNEFVYVMGPESGNLPAEKELLAMVDAKEKADIKPYEEKAIASSLLEAEPKSGKVLSKTSNAALGTTELKLSNGVTVTLKPTTFKDDQVLMGARRAGGQNGYGLKDKFNAQYATQVVGTMGVGSFSPTDLKKMLAGKSVSVTPTIGQISEGVTGNSSVKDIETMLQLTHLYFTSPRKDSSLFKSFVQKNKAQFANIGADPQTSFIDTMYKVMYNNNPLAPAVVPKPEFFDKVDMDRAVQIYKERFSDVNGMHFVFVGSFKENEIVPMIEKYIGSLPSTSKKFTFTDNKVRPISGKKELEVYKGKEEQSLILSFYTGEGPYSQDMDIKMRAVSEVLNIRIIEELREKIQGIYGGGTFVQFEKYPYSRFNMILQLPCGPEKVDTLIKAVNKEFEDIVKKGPDKSYLDKVKKQWIESYRTNVKENGVWLNQLLDARFKGLDMKYFTNYESYVNKLTPADVQAAAKVLLAGNNRFVAVLKPEKYKGEERKKGF